MLTYARLGAMHYERRPVPVTPINIRAAWEFFACLTGSIKAWLSGPGDDEVLRERTLWVFPRLHPHGWLSDAPCGRATFHFRDVPKELERLLPPRGYYRVPLSKADCNRLRVLAQSAIEATTRPTEVLALQEQSIKSELSLMALGEVALRPLSKTRLAEQKTEAALDWYALHLVLQRGFQVPGDGFTFTIGVRGQIDLRSLLGLGSQVFDYVFLFGRDHIAWLKVVLDIHAHTVGWQVADVTHRCLHGVGLAQEPTDRPRLGWRFDNDHLGTGLLSLSRGLGGERVFGRVQALVGLRVTKACDFRSALGAVTLRRWANLRTQEYRPGRCDLSFLPALDAIAQDWSVSHPSLSSTLECVSPMHCLGPRRLARIRQHGIGRRATSQILIQLLFSQFFYHLPYRLRFLLGTDE